MQTNRGTKPRIPEHRPPHQHIGQGVCGGGGYQTPKVLPILRGGGLGGGEPNTITHTLAKSKQKGKC